MLKTLSLSLVICPILIFGFHKSYKDFYRIKDLSELYKALNIFKNEISYSNKTISDSFNSIYKKTNEPISLIFLDSSIELKNNTDIAFQTILIKSINKYNASTYLSKKDIYEFISLSHTINHLDSDSIISSINIFLSYIENELNLVKNTSIQTKKTGQSLTILSAILIIIILL